MRRVLHVVLPLALLLIPARGALRIVNGTAYAPLRAVAVPDRTSTPAPMFSIVSIARY